MMTLNEKLIELKAISDAATPGPWEIVGRNGIRATVHTVQKNTVDQGLFVARAIDKPSIDNIPGSERTATFIAASRTAMPQLIEGLSEAVKELALINEGEGCDEQVYMDMAGNVLARIAEILEVKK